MYCIYTPKAPNGKPSKLWQDLMAYYKNDRWTVKTNYVMTLMSNFKKDYGDKMIYDENGEPTLESILSIIADADGSTAKEAAEMEHVFNDTEYDKVTDLVSDVVRFNETHEGLIAEIVSMTKKGHYVVVNPVDKNSANKKQQMADAWREHKGVADILKRFGIGITVLDSDKINNADAIMSPEHLGETAKGMLGVINIANNLNGYNSLTEEFSHFIVEILNTEGNPFVTRAENFLKRNPELVRAILGSDYDTVTEYYMSQDDEDLIYREALGRIVEKIVNNTYTGGRSQIIDRTAKAVLDFIKTRFKTDDVSIWNELDEIMNGMSDSVKEFMQRETLKEETLQRFKKTAKTLAHATATLDELKERLARATARTEANIIKYLSVYEYDKKITAEMTMLFKTLHDQAKTAKFFDGAIGFVNEVVTVLRDNLDALKAVELTDDLSLYEIRKYAHNLMLLKNMMQCYKDPVREIKAVMKEILNSDEISDDYRNIIESSLKTVFPECLDVLDDIDEEFCNTNRKVVEMFAKSYFNNGNGDLVVPFGKAKGSIITLESILDASNGDISMLDRMLLSAANTPDTFIQLADHVIQNQNELIRAATLDLDHEIQIIDKEYRDSGSYDGTSFIYERDDKGKLTGNLTSKYKIWLWQRDREKEIESMKELMTDPNTGEVDEDSLQKHIAAWDKVNSQNYYVQKEIWYTDEKGKKHKELKTSHFLLPANIEKYKNQDYQKGWDAAHKAYYDKYVKMKVEKIDMLLPDYMTHPFRAIQMMVASTGEAILNSDNGFFGGVRNAVSAMMDNYFRITENDNGEYFDGTAGTVKAYIEALKKKYGKKDDEKATTTLNFDKTVHHRVPTYFLKSLDDMSKLSTDATSALREYNIMANHYNGMHKIADIMECFRELGQQRHIYQGTKQNGKLIKEHLKRRIDKTTYHAEMTAELPIEMTNQYKRLNDLIDMQVYSRAKEQGSTIFGNFTTGKLCDNLIKLTSFSLLGYSAFSGVNNVVAAKYQMLIESFGGKYFNMKDWVSADKEYMKMAPEMFAELCTPYTTSKMGLLGEDLNVGQNWKNHIKESKAFRNNFVQFLSNFGPSCLLECGEHAIQMSTAIAFLKHYKLYYGPITKDEKGNITNDSVSLFDAIEKKEIKNSEGKVVDAKLQLKDEYKNYVKADGKKFQWKRGSDDLKRLSLLIGKINQDMHGIYNPEDFPVLCRTGIGRMLMLFRKHMVPQLQKRYKGIGKFQPVYNFRSGEFEEGYVVTFFRVIKDLTMSRNAVKRLQLEGIDENIGALARMKLVHHALTDYEKCNFKKAATEFALLIFLAFLCGCLMTDWDDEDDWTKRQIMYFAKRAKLEAEMPYRLSSFMDILKSPSAVISQMQKYTKVIGSIGDNHILESGPYKGHTVLYANIMRALPVYPQIYDFVHIDEDNRRFNAFKQLSIIENILKKK